MLTDEFWYMQDETKINKLDEQDFLMVVIDVLGHPVDSVFERPDVAFILPDL